MEFGVWHARDVCEWGVCMCGWVGVGGRVVGCMDSGEWVLTDYWKFLLPYLSGYKTGFPIL